LLASNSSVIVQAFDVSAGTDLNDLSTDDFPGDFGLFDSPGQTFTAAPQAAVTPSRQAVSVAPESFASPEVRPVAGHPALAPAGLLAVLGVEAPAALAPAAQILTVQ